MLALLPIFFAGRCGVEPLLMERSVGAPLRVGDAVLATLPVAWLFPPCVRGILRHHGAPCPIEKLT